MAGYPQNWEVRTRNRQYSNQPGSLAKPEQEMVRDFSFDSPESTHMRGMAELLRTPDSVEAERDYTESNVPDSGEERGE